MKTLIRISVFAAFLASAAMSFGQTALSSTTLSSAVTDTKSTSIVVASVTNISAPTPFQTSGLAGVTTQLYIDDEVFDVEGVNTTAKVVVVRRGANGTRARTHASGTNVYIIQMQQQGSALIAYPLGGSCTAGQGNAQYTPTIDYNDGYVFQCNNGVWTLQSVTGQQHFPVVTVLSTSYVNNSTTLGTITNMSFPVVANHSYTLTCQLVWQASATTAGPKYQATGPTGATAVLLAVDGGTGATAYADASTAAFSAVLTTFGTAGATATNYVNHVTLGVANGTTAGTVALQAAANGSGTVTFQPGSYCIQQ